MSDTTIRASIKTLMDAVTGIGIVHDYDRWTADTATLAQLFKTDPNDPAAPLHGWEITRDAIPTIARLTASKYKVTHGYSIKGYYALKDSVASEKLFQLVIDAVIQKFIDNRIAGAEGHSLPTVQKIVPYMFAGVLCHHAELKMNVTEIVAATAEADQALIKIMLDNYLKPDDDVIVPSEISITP